MQFDGGVAIVVALALGSVHQLHISLTALLFDFRCRGRSEDFELISEMFPSSPSVNIQDNGTSTLNKTSQSQHKRIPTLSCFHSRSLSFLAFFLSVVIISMSSTGRVFS
jgi:hypothetical protein